MNNFLYWTKKIITSLLYPLPVVLLLFLVGFWFLSRGRKTILASFFLIFGFFWLALWSFPFFPTFLLEKLESPNRRLGSREQILTAFPGVDRNLPFIVVLGGGASDSDDPSVKELSKLPDSAFRRVLEGVRLHEYFPQAKIIMSGSSLEAKVMSRVAVVLGVPGDEILQESQSRDTEDEARYIKTMVKGERFFLVTSAWHMTRSVGLFRKQGLVFIPSPTDFYTHQGGKSGDGGIYWNLPDAGYLLKSQMVIKEYLGMMAERCLGKI